MLGYRKIVEEIQGYMNSPDQSQDDKVRELSSQYAEACRDVNDRLRECQLFIEQGFRSQALALAEVEPNLLDLVAILDFTERDEWEEIVASYGWDRAYGLKVDAADLLNESYEMEETLKPLLKQHRRLALARAPLSRRMEVLRQISERDAGVAAWREDLKNCEVARLQELVSIGNEANSAADFDTLQELVDEWQNTPWTAKAPRELDSKLEAFYRALAKGRLVPNTICDIVAARSQGDVLRLRDLETVWQKMMERIGSREPAWKIDKESNARVEEAFRWLRQRLREAAVETSFRQAVGILEAAISRKEPPHVVQKLDAAARDFGRPLPASVETQLQAYWRNRKIHTAGELALWFVVAIVGGGLFLVLLSWFLKSR